MPSCLKFSTALIATAMLAVSGCGGGPTLGTVPVTGTVTLDGKPVEGAAVVFSPEGEGHAASGTTDASGNFVLTTQVSGDGAVPGAYQVTVTKYEHQEVAQGPPADDMDAAYAAAEAAGERIGGVANPEAERPAKSLVPEKYTNPKTSGLTATVTEEGDNKVTLELTR